MHPSKAAEVFDELNAERPGSRKNPSRSIAVCTTRSGAPWNGMVSCAGWRTMDEAAAHSLLPSAAVAEATQHGPPIRVRARHLSR